MDATLAAIADHLRGEGAAPVGSAALRAQERAFAARLREEGDASGTGLTAQLAEAFDRMTDSIDTLAHVLRGQGNAAAPDRS